MPSQKGKRFRREARKVTAEKRQIDRLARSDAEQLKLIDVRPGRSAKERALLLSRLKNELKAS